MGKNEITLKRQFEKKAKLQGVEPPKDSIPEPEENPLDAENTVEESPFSSIEEKAKEGCKKCDDARKQRAKAEAFAQSRTGVRVKKNPDITCSLCGNVQSSVWKKCRVCDTEIEK